MTADSGTWKKTWKCCLLGKLDRTNLIYRLVLDFWKHLSSLRPQVPLTWKSIRCFGESSQLFCNMQILLQQRHSKTAIAACPHQITSSPSAGSPHTESLEVMPLAVPWGTKERSAPAGLKSEKRISGTQKFQHRHGDLEKNLCWLFIDWRCITSLPLDISVLLSKTEDTNRVTCELCWILLLFFVRAPFVSL